MHPQPETYWGNVNPIGPRGVYDEAKRYAEALTMAYHNQQGVNTAIARIFNTYGPRMRRNDGRATVTFLHQALEGKPLTVFGDGSQTRSLCYVDDLIRGLYLLAMSDEHLPVNIGNPDHELTMLELARGLHPRHRLGERDRVRGAAGRRSARAPAGHHQGGAGARLGARDRPRRGARRWVRALGREPVGVVDAPRGVSRAVLAAALLAATAQPAHGLALPAGRDLRRGAALYGTAVPTIATYKQLHVQESSG